MARGALLYQCKRCNQTVRIAFHETASADTFRVLWELATFNASRDIKLDDGRLLSQVHIHRCDKKDCLGVMELIGADGYYPESLPIQDESRYEKKA